MLFDLCIRGARSLHGALSLGGALVSLGLVSCSGEGSDQRQTSGTAPGTSPSTPAGPEVSAPAPDPATPSESTTGAEEAQNPSAPLDLVASATPAGGAASEGPSAASEFELAWQDDFDAFEATRWQLMTHSWDTNLAQFSTANVRVENGIAALQLTPEPSDAIKPFRGVEMRSVQTLTYGRVEARAKLAKGSGVVSSLVLIYTPWPADDWNELDIEYLGRYADRAQFNSMVYLGPPTTPPVTQSVTPTQYPQLAPLGFDPSADFHVYAMDWTPSQARFSVDGQVMHTWDTEIERLKLPMNILLTIWASSAAEWAGPIDASTAPAAAEYDWLKVYRYTGAEP
jgi:endo-1,3-1,4-beta-glycanase ExoK